MISKKRIRAIIAHAKKVSTFSTYRYQLGAVIFRGKRIVCTGFNKNKTHPTAVKYFKHGSLHAEIDAVLHAPENLKGTSIFVYRSLKNGSSALAKPCAMCVQVLHEFGVKEAFWTTPNMPYWDNALVEDLHKQIDKQEALMDNSY